MTRRSGWGPETSLMGVLDSSVHAAHPTDSRPFIQQVPKIRPLPTNHEPPTYFSSTVGGRVTIYNWLQIPDSTGTYMEVINIA